MSDIDHEMIIGAPKPLSIGPPKKAGITLAFMESWARRIRDLLDEGRPNGLDDAGLAKACKVKQPSIWQWFNAPQGRASTKNISAINAVRAARYLGTTAEYIMTGQGQRHVSQDAVLDRSMLESAIVSVKKHLRARGLELDVFIAAPMIAYAYRERMKLPRDLSTAEYKEFDAAIASKLRGELGDDRERGRSAEGGARGDDEIAATPAPTRRRRG